MTRLVLISDTHNRHNQLLLPEGDILVHAGDATSRGRSHEIRDFLKWFGTVRDYTHRVLIAGNHDYGFEQEPEKMAAFIPDNVTYLKDNGVQLQGLNIWGSPVQPTFHDWAFNRSGPEIQEHWDLIPHGTDVLVTHGPPAGILDGVLPYGHQVGCPRLLTKVLEIKPRLHVFGHIHESAGMLKAPQTTFVNASVCDHRYLPVNAPTVLDLEGVRR